MLCEHMQKRWVIVIVGQGCLQAYSLIIVKAEVKFLILKPGFQISIILGIRPELHGALLSWFSSGAYSFQGASQRWVWVSLFHL